MTQEQQVIQALKVQGGWATLRRLNEVLDFSTWATKTPEASVRCIVQRSDSIFKIKPGLWALEECREEVLKRFGLIIGDKKSEEVFTHAYYQGLLVEIGKFSGYTTYIPPQDKHRLYLGDELANIADATSMPSFTYNNLLRKAKTVDVVWFNHREMPSHFYEVEHTTDIKNSLSKFYELQDFYAHFYIVADLQRQREYDDKINMSIFREIASRVKFIPYSQVIDRHSNLKLSKQLLW